MNTLCNLCTGILFSVLLFSGCGEAPAGTDPAEKRAELLTAFSQLADEETGMLDKEASLQYVQEADAFATEFPDDTLAALPLYRSAEISRSIGDPKKAIATYQKVLASYPTFHKAAEARFMLAFSYDEDLNELESARTAYQDFLSKHPNHTFADDAEMLLSNLGKSDEQILQELEAQLQAQEEQ